MQKLTLDHGAVSRMSSEIRRRQRGLSESVIFSSLSFGPRVSCGISTRRLIEANCVGFKAAYAQKDNKVAVCEMERETD